MAHPRASDLDAEAAWLLVRSRALAVVATATDAVTRDWALSFCDERVVACDFDVASAAVGKSGRWALIMAKSLAPGGDTFSEVLGDRWPVKDHGVILSSTPDATPERAKCLYLSVATKKTPGYRSGVERHQSNVRHAAYLASITFFRFHPLRHRQQL